MVVVKLHQQLVKPVPCHLRDVTVPHISFTNQKMVRRLMLEMTQTNHAMGCQQSSLQADLTALLKMLSFAMNFQKVHHHGLGTMLTPLLVA
uniref:Uncharacterized protein n=1 Tax=Arundo donax TaxID=35708 RepID=A0A0A9DUQ0_ARUDO